MEKLKHFLKENGLRIVTWVPDDKKEFYAVFAHQFANEEAQLYGSDNGKSVEVYGKGATPSIAMNNLLRVAAGQELSADDSDTFLTAPVFTIPKDSAA